MKPSDPNAANGVLGAMPSMRPQGKDGITISNMPLRLLIRMTYGVQDFQIVGGPTWQMSNRFDISAKAADGTTQGTQDLLPMMKTLLADRFKLKTHMETRELPTYALVVARSDGKLGPNLKPSTSDCSNAEAEAKKQKWPVAITIVDTHGDLVMFQKLDQTQFGSIEISIEKAKTAALYRRPSKAFEDLIAQGGVNLRLSRHPALPIEGGVPLSVDGKIIGAIGVSGVKSNEDGIVAEAGAGALKSSK